MLTIDFLAGTHIDDAARMLVESAPARGDFAGIMLRARYATTNPRDIVARYHRLSTERCEAWQRSPEGKRIAAEVAARTAQLQATADRLIDLLPDLPMDHPASVLAWVREMAEPSDRVGVKWNRAAIVAHFVAHGWGVNVNCGEAFNGEDARNFAGWIVGQWLASGYPGVVMFIDRWTEKFGART